MADKYRIICPQTDSCPVYKNWIKQTGGNIGQIGKKRIDVIFQHGSSSYSCLALSSLYDMEGWFCGESKSIKGRLDQKVEPDCAQLVQLNNSRQGG